jgi:hypothetical protein
MRMVSLSIFEPVSQHSFCHAFNDIDDREISISDHRKDPDYFSKRPMTNSDLSLCKFAEPRFGDIEELWGRTKKYLQSQGLSPLNVSMEY